MGGHGEEPRFGAVGGVGMVAGLAQRPLGLGAVGDIAADALQIRRMIRVGADQAFPPGDPSRSQRGFDLLVMNAGAARFMAASPCSRTVSAKSLPTRVLRGSSARAQNASLTKVMTPSLIAQHDLSRPGI